MSKKRELEELKRRWYNKLKKEGFDDIEYADGSLRSGLPRTPSQKDSITQEATKEYYYMANQFLHTYAFKNERERVIWEYHTNGLSSREIAKVLKKVKITISSAWVRVITKRLTNIMKHEYLLGYEPLQ